MPSLSSWRKSAPLDGMRAGVGALVGIVCTGLVSWLWLGREDALPALIAPMGASAVLLFAVPASPLAQPRAVLGGNILSALVGIAAAMAIDAPMLAAGVAVGGAIALMRLAGCLHPPGGAVALTAVIGGPAILGAGWSFALFPVAINSALLLGLAWGFHRATGGTYPHRAPALPASTHGTKDPPAQERIGYTIADIDAVLARYDALLDVDSADLDALFRAVEVRAHRRLHGEIRCAAIMSRDLVTAAPDEPLHSARERLFKHRLVVLPVIDGEAHVLGLVGHAELRIEPSVDSAQIVAVVMAPATALTTPETPIDALLPMLSGGGAHVALVVDADNRLVGVVTQTDLLAALWRGHVAEQVAVTEAKAA